MTIEFLKRSKPEAERAEDDAKVRAVVESTLADIAARGDAAVRDLSQKFDKQFGRFSSKKLSLKNNVYFRIFFTQADSTRTIPKRCKGVHFVDLGESFPTHIYLQNLASIQPRTSLLKFDLIFTYLPRPEI